MKRDWESGKRQGAEIMEGERSPEEDAIGESPAEKEGPAENENLAEKGSPAENKGLAEEGSPAENKGLAEEGSPAVGEGSAAEGETFLLKLYVAGQTPKSLAALNNLREICETHLHGRYQIEVIDLVQEPALAREDQILAIPTLVRSLPVPISRIIGDLSDTDRVLVGLNIQHLT